MKALHSILGRYFWLFAIAVYIILSLTIVILNAYKIPFLGNAVALLCSSFLSTECGGDLIGIILRLVLVGLVLGASSAVLYPLPDHTSPLFRFVHLVEFILNIRKPGALVQNGYKVPGQNALGNGVLVVDGVSAALLKQENGRLRAVGPGVHQTYNENLVRVFDLRPQMRDMGIRGFPADTKDGISVRVDFTFMYMIDPGQIDDARLTPNQLFGFTSVSEDSLMKLVYESEPASKSGGNETYDWREEIEIIAENELRQTVGKYLFDDLYAPFDLSANPRRELGRRTLETLIPQLQLRGVKIIDLSIGRIRPIDEAIIKRRISSWRANKERQSQYLKEQGKIQAQRERSMAFRHAQLQLLTKLIDGLQDIPERDRSTILKLRLSKALENSLGQYLAKSK